MPGKTSERKITRKEFVKKAAVGAAVVGAAGLGLAKGAKAQGLGPMGSQTTVYPTDSLTTIRHALYNFDVVNFDGSSGDPFILTDDVPDGAVLEITRPVTLQGLDEGKPPIILVTNTAFDKSLQNFEAHGIRVLIEEGRRDRHVSFRNLAINDNGNKGAGLYRGLWVVACDDLEILNCKVFTDPYFPNLSIGESYLDFYGTAGGALHIGSDMASSPSLHKISGTVRIEGCEISGPIGLDFSSTNALKPDCITDITAKVTVTGCHITGYYARGLGVGGDASVQWNNGDYNIWDNRLDTGIQGSDANGVLYSGMPTVMDGLAGKLELSGNELFVNGYIWGLYGIAIEIEQTKKETFRGRVTNNRIHMNGPPPQDDSFLTWTFPILSFPISGSQPTYNLSYDSNSIDGPCPVDVMAILMSCHDCEFKNFNRKEMAVTDHQTLLLAAGGLDYYKHVDFALLANFDGTDQSTGNVVIDNYKAVPAAVYDTSDPEPGSQDYAGENILKGNLKKAYHLAGSAPSVPEGIQRKIARARKVLKGGPRG